MRDTITAKLDTWRQGLQQLQQQRAELSQRLQDTDAAILRNQGAILGAEELLRELEQGEGEQPPTE